MPSQEHLYRVALLGSDIGELHTLSSTLNSSEKRISVSLWETGVANLSKIFDNPSEEESPRAPGTAQDRLTQFDAVVYLCAEGENSLPEPVQQLRVRHPYLPLLAVVQDQPSQATVRQLHGEGARDVLPFKSLSSSQLLVSVVNAVEGSTLAMDLRAALRDKEVLIRNIHHRAKNNLQVICSLLFLQLRDVESPHADRHLLVATERILSMAAVQEEMYRTQDFSAISTNSCFRRIGNTLERQLKAKGVGCAFTYHVEDYLIDADRAVPLVLLLNELVNLCARPLPLAEGRTCTLKMTISLRQEDQNLLLGVSLSSCLTQPTQAEDSGLLVASSLARQLRGSFTVNEDRRGAEVRFPLGGARPGSQS